MRHVLASVLSISLVAATADAAQQCHNAIGATSASQQYHINGDGTVTDTKNNLMWLQCTVGQQWKDRRCPGEAITTTHEGALMTARQHNHAGYTNWRLPTIYELSTLTELRCYQPAINLAVFPGTPAADYWTSTVFSNDSDMAWLIHFQYGENYTAVKSHKARVRLVRSVAPWPDRRER